MALTLAFDTSAAHCAAALLFGDHCVVRHEPMATGQSERLLPFLNELLAAGGVAWPDLTVIGTGIGPGNFTGTRIAVAAARGLALALDIPAVGVSTLEAMALGQNATVVMDARRGMAYAQPFDVTGPLADPVLVAADAPPPFDIGADPCFVGDLAAGYAARFYGSVTTPLYPLPEAMARIAEARAAAGPAPRPAPLYLRGADAAPPRDPPPTILAPTSSPA